jgi:type IV secretion system protein VirB4
MGSAKISAGLSGVATRENESALFIPYIRHVTPEVIALSTGALMTMVEIEGLSFETADTRDLNAHHSELNTLYRNIADERLALWSILLRRRTTDYPSGTFTSTFSRDLDAKYRARMIEEELFTNRLIVCVVHQPTGSAVGGLSKAKLAAAEIDADAIKRLTDATAILMAGLGCVRQLGIVERDGVHFSEASGVLHHILGGEQARVPLTMGTIGSAIYADRIVFGRETVEIRHENRSRFGAVLALKEYPARTRPTMLAELLTLRFELTVCQSFRFLAKATAGEIMTRKQNQMVSAGDKAGSQIAQLTDAVDDLESNRFCLGEHHFTATVFADTMSALKENVSLARSAITNGGSVVVREDLGLEAAWWAQLPGNFKYRPRSAAITSRNFAALSPFHGFPKGRKEGNAWGPAVALLKTASGGAYHFNFHDRDLGNTFVCGPSGSGKTVVLNFMLAQLEKHRPRMVFFDKDRGAELFVRAAGGTYFAFKRGRPTGCAPLKAFEASPAAEVFLAKWVEKLVGLTLTAQERNDVAFAVRSVMTRPADERSIGALRSFLTRSQSGSLRVADALVRWARGGPLDWVFDNECDALGLDARFVGYDMTEFYGDADDEVRVPLMAYLFHRVESLITGERLVIVIDEFWKALADPDMARLIQDKLKTIRKQNGMLLLATQSPRDALLSPLAHTIIEQCPTQIFMPNPRGDAADYVDGLKLTHREFELIAHDMSSNSRRFLIRQGQASVVAELNLTGFDAELAILSGRTEYIELMERVLREGGPDPDVWLPMFHQQRRLRVAA